jgi:hypothetical protein
MVLKNTNKLFLFSLALLCLLFLSGLAFATCPQVNYEIVEQTFSQDGQTTKIKVSCNPDTTKHVTPGVTNSDGDVINSSKINPTSFTCTSIPTEVVIKDLMQRGMYTLQISRDEADCSTPSKYFFTVKANPDEEIAIPDNNIFVIFIVLLVSIGLLIKTKK